MIVYGMQVLLTETHLAIVMEYASGGELFDRISNAGRFSEDEVTVSSQIYQISTLALQLVSYTRSIEFSGQIFLPTTDIGSQLLSFNGNVTHHQQLMIIKLVLVASLTKYITCENGFDAANLPQRSQTRECAPGWEFNSTS